MRCASTRATACLKAHATRWNMLRMLRCMHRRLDFTNSASVSIYFRVTDPSQSMARYQRRNASFEMSTLSLFWLTRGTWIIKDENYKEMDEKMVNRVKQIFRIRAVKRTKSQWTERLSRKYFYTDDFDLRRPLDKVRLIERKELRRYKIYYRNFTAIIEEFDDSRTFLNARNKLGAFSKIPQGFLSKGNLFPTELYLRTWFMHRYELVLIPIRIYVYRKLYRGTWGVDASQYVSTCRAPFALSFVLAGKCQVFIEHSQIHFISFLVDRSPALFAYVEYTIDLK